MSRLHNFLASWLALAIVASGATGLRIPGLPLGPGEILLATWLAFVGFLLLRGLKIHLGPTFRVFFFYWLGVGALLGLGALVAATTVGIDPDNAGHDTLAFILQAVFVCFAVMFVDDKEFYIAVARRMLFLFAFFATAILIVGYISPRGLGFEIWYGGKRYSGWATNPNQMALFALGMPYLGWYMMRRARGLASKLPYIVAICACIWVGIETASDGLRVAWLGSATVLGGWAWCRSLLAQRGRYLYISFLVIPIAAISMTIGFGGDFVDKLDRAVQDMYNEGDQGEGRVVRWTNGIKAIMHSPVVGFGPGSYSGVTGPFQSKEAHNSIIDWGASTGVLGIVLHLGLFAWCVLRTLRAGELALFGMLTALAGASMFGYMLRQPIYWMLLVLVLMLSADRVPARARTAAGRSSDVPNSPRTRLSAQH
jgi:O-antigen ligase